MGHKTGLANHRPSRSGLTSGCLRASCHYRSFSELPHPPGDLPHPLLAAEVGRVLPRAEASALGPQIHILCYHDVPIKLSKQMLPCGFIFSLPGEEILTKLHHTLCLDLEKEL